MTKSNFRQTAIWSNGKSCKPKAPAPSEAKKPVGIVSTPLESCNYFSFLIIMGMQVRAAENMGKFLALKQTCQFIPTVSQSKMLFLVCVLGKNTFSLITSHFYWTMTSTLWVPMSLSDKESTCNAGDMGLIPRSGRFSGKGNGNPLQCSCLENPMERGAWQVTVHAVAKSGPRLNTHTHDFHPAEATGFAVGWTSRADSSRKSWLGQHSVGTPFLLEEY